MLTTELFIAIISLCITCFALGYTVGSKSNNKTQEQPPGLQTLAVTLVTKKSG